MGKIYTDAELRAHSTPGEPEQDHTLGHVHVIAGKHGRLCGKSWFSELGFQESLKRPNGHRRTVFVKLLRRRTTTDSHKVCGVLKLEVWSLWFAGDLAIWAKQHKGLTKNLFIEKFVFSHLFLPDPPYMRAYTGSKNSPHPQVSYIFGKGKVSAFQWCKEQVIVVNDYLEYFDMGKMNHFRKVLISSFRKQLKRTSGRIAANFHQRALWVFYMVGKPLIIAFRICMTFGGSGQKMLAPSGREDDGIDPFLANFCPIAKRTDRKMPI